MKAKAVNIRTLARLAREKNREVARLERILARKRGELTTLEALAEKFCGPQAQFTFDAFLGHLANNRPDLHAILKEGVAADIFIPGKVLFAATAARHFGLALNKGRLQKALFEFYPEVEHSLEIVKAK